MQPFFDGKPEYRGALYMQGRLGKKDLARRLGVTELPVIAIPELLVLRITEEVHREDHR